jgi:hypothetical protein
VVNENFLVVTNGLAGFVCQFEANRTAGFSLAYRRASARVTVWCNIFDLQGNNIAISQLGGSW